MFKEINSKNLLYKNCMFIFNYCMMSLFL